MADSAIECREYSEEGAAAASRPSSDNRQQVVLQEIDGRSGRHTVVTPGRHLMSSVWCVVLRMLDAVGDFLLELKWRDDLIDKWKEALQALEVVDEGMSRDVSECHRVDETEMMAYQRGISLCDTKAVGLPDPCEKKIPERKDEGEATDKVEIIGKEIEVDNRTTTNTDLTAGRQVKAAAWCVALRMLDVVENFSLKGEWRGDLIDKWREAFQLLEAVSKGLPLQVSKHHPGHSHSADESTMKKMMTKERYLCQVLETEVDIRTTTDLTAGPQVLSAAWCVVLRVLDVVANFSEKGVWRSDLIDKWREAFQLLEAVRKGMPLQVSKYHPGHSCSADESTMKDDDKRERSLSSDSKAQELSGPCEEKIAGSRRKSEGEAAVKLGLVKKYVNTRSSRGPRLMLATQCVALRMLDVVAHFSLKREWSDCLIDKWREAFQVLESVARGIDHPLSMSKDHPGHSFSFDEPGMTDDKRWRSLSNDTKALGLLGSCEEKLTGRKEKSEAIDKVGLNGKDVSESAVIEMPSNQSKKMSPKPVGQSGASRVCELVETPIESDHAGGEVADSSAHSTVQYMQEQEMVSPLVGQHDHSYTPVQETSHSPIDQTDASSHQGEGRSVKQGWRCAHDAVMSLPQRKVIRHVVERCALEWYRLGIELGYEDGEIQDMTVGIPTPQGKLQVIIERKANEHGKKKAVEALLDACDQIIPLATVAVMEDLGLKYTGTVSDHLLFELGNEVGSDWKELAQGLGMAVKDMDNIEMEARTRKDQAWKMLQLWHSIKGRDFNVDEIFQKLQQIRKKQQTKQQRNVIFPENVHDDKRLCGRQKELEGIARKFWGQTANKETPTGISKFCLQVVNGMGGAGKSALAEKYAFLWQKMYTDGVFYFNAESLATLHLSIRKNLRDLSLRSEGGVFDDNQIFLQQIYAKDKVLLLYDGADDLNLLKKILPRDTALVHMLVTTRVSGDHPILSRADKITSLGRLGADAGVEALQAWRGLAGRRLKGKERMYARRVVSESPIEGLPLAIAHVATLMRKAGFNCEQYYRLFKDRQAQLQALALDMDKLLHYFHISNLSESLLDRGVSEPKDLLKVGVEDVQSITTKPNERHLLSMARYFVMSTDHVHLTWQLDIETVKETDSNAMQILSYASLMASRNIPEYVLRPLVFGDGLMYPYRLSVSTLTSHTLVDVSESNEGCSLHMHPLVQSTVLERVFRQLDELQHRLKRMCQCLLGFLPRSSLGIQRHLVDDQFISLIPHVYAVATKSVRIHDDDTCALVQIACKIALVSHHVDVAFHLCSEQLKATDESATIQQRWLALYDMGQAFVLMVNPQAAQNHFVKALQLIESCNVHEKMTMEHEYELVLGKLADCYTAQEMFTEAESVHQIELSLLNERPDANQQDLATGLGNMANNYMLSGRTEKAIETYGQVLEIQTRDRQTSPLQLCKALANRGQCLMENGQCEKALPLLERCLSISREHLPGDHVDMAEGLRILSICCERLGDVQRATQLCEESMAIACHCLPDNHPKIALYMGQLASCHDSAGNVDVAIHLTQQCIEVLRQNLPSTRKDLCAALNNLGFYYRKKGMFDDAIRTYEECLAAQQSFLPPHHPDIGMTLWNLGRAYKMGNNTVKATELLRECLSIREKSLSATHPDLIAVLTALGTMTFKQGLYDESLQIRGRLRDILMTTSPMSKHMATVCYNMGMCYKELSQLDAAEEAFSQSLSINKAIFPQDHNRILIIEQVLHQVWQLKFGHW